MTTLVVHFLIYKIVLMTGQTCPSLNHITNFCLTYKLSKNRIKPKIIQYHKILAYFFILFLQKINDIHSFKLIEYIDKIQIQIR